MAGKTKHPSYDEVAGRVASPREQVRALQAELHRRRAEHARGAATGAESAAALGEGQGGAGAGQAAAQTAGAGAGAAARAARAASDGFLAEARASPVGHRGETGWREDGQNGWVWTLTTPTVRLFRCSRSRAGAVARALLGPDAEGVIVSDCYTAYGQLDDRHQRCWAHLLREIHELKTQPPDDAGLHAWAEGMPALFTEAVAWTGAAGGALPAARERARCRVETAVLALCRVEPAGGPHAALCQRMARSHPELFTFVADPAVPATNNAAERALRPLVIARKISGGSRSTHGSRPRLVLQSVVATWDLGGLDPPAEMLALLRAPRTPLLELPLV